MQCRKTSMNMRALLASCLCLLNSLPILPYLVLHVTKPLVHRPHKFNIFVFALRALLLVDLLMQLFVLGIIFVEPLGFFYDLLFG